MNYGYGFPSDNAYNYDQWFRESNKRLLLYQKQIFDIINFKRPSTRCGKRPNVNKEHIRQQLFNVQEQRRLELLQQQEKANEMSRKEMEARHRLQIERLQSKFCQPTEQSIKWHTPKKTSNNELVDVSVWSHSSHDKFYAPKQSNSSNVSSISAPLTWSEKSIYVKELSRPSNAIIAVNTCVASEASDSLSNNMMVCKNETDRETSTSKIETPKFDGCKVIVPEVNCKSISPPAPLIPTITVDEIPEVTSQNENKSTKLTTTDRSIDEKGVIDDADVIVLPTNCLLSRAPSKLTTETLLKYCLSSVANDSDTKGEYLDRFIWLSTKSTLKCTEYSAWNGNRFLLSQPKLMTSSFSKHGPRMTSSFNSQWRLWDPGG